MKIETCKVPFPLLSSFEERDKSSPREKELIDQIWASSGPRTPKIYAAKMVRMMFHLEGDVHLLSSLVGFVFHKLPRKVVGPLLEVIWEFIEFLLAVDTIHPHACRAWIEGGAMMVERVEPCRYCLEDLATIPKSHPEFCSDACALSWVKCFGDKIHKLDNLDSMLQEAMEHGEEEGRAAVAADIQESVQCALENSNPLLTLIRSHLGDPSLDLESAAWKLELAMRRGRVHL